MYPNMYYFYSRYIMHFASFLPVRRQMIFRAGNEPHENADEIVRYLQQEYKGKPYKITYLTEKDEEVKFYRDVEYLDRNILRMKASFCDVLKYSFSYGRASYLLYENEAIRKVRKKQKIIYLNHGTIPLKYVADVLRQPDELDYAVCPSKGCAQIYKEQYGIPETKQLYMMPPRIRNIFHVNKEQVDKLLGSTDKQVILWLPTFRELEGSYRIDSFQSNPLKILISDGGLSEAEKRLKANNQILIIKEHPREKIGSFFLAIAEIFYWYRMNSYRVMRFRFRIYWDEQML